MKKLLGLLVFCLMLPSAFAESSATGKDFLRTTDEQNTINIFRQVSPAVVHISTLTSTAKPVTDPPQQGIGSGFIFDRRGYILTNAHVIEGAEIIDVILGNGELIKGTVIGADGATDIAIVKIEPPSGSMPVVTMGDSSRLEIGQKAIAIGNPYGLDQTISVGIVSGLNRITPNPARSGSQLYIQTDAAINFGNSGGPLLNSQGEVIGINTAIIASAQNLAFAVPINTAKAVIPELLASGRVVRPWLGITGRALTKKIMDLIKLPLAEGILVEEVQKGSPADKAGIKTGELLITVEGEKYLLGGDIITKINGQPTPDVPQFLRIISRLKPGDNIKMEIFREGKIKKLELTLSEKPQ
jgi:S1-C subfamily serine protease